MLCHKQTYYVSCLLATTAYILLRLTPQCYDSSSYCMMHGLWVHVGLRERIEGIWVPFDQTMARLGLGLG